MPEHVIVDTNVGVVANGSATTSLTLELACVELLENIARTGHLVLDGEDRIFDEYRKHLSLSGQPGVGDIFMKWVHDNRHNPSLCTLVALTPQPDDDMDFSEFPRDATLRTFDRADRKFVAVAMSHQTPADVCVAGDRGWRRHDKALTAHGVTIRWLGH